ncbi:MAG: PepSY-associated TM helix domain-containing protein [Pseudomonadota bacterium]
MPARRQWFAWHSLFGLQCSILLSFVLVTGTLATVSLEIDWLATPQMRHHGEVVRDYDWGGMLDSARAAYPQAEILSLDAPAAPWVNAEVIARSEDNPRFRIFVDPATAKVRGIGRWNNWRRFFRQIHRHLNLPVAWGVSIVGLLSLPLLVSLVSSFYIYRRWWAGFFRLPPRGAHGKSTAVKVQRVEWGYWHRLLGVWSLWFLLLMGVTGIWYLAEQWGLRASYPPLPAASETFVATPGGAELNDLLAQVEQEWPEFRTKQIVFELSEPGMTKIQGQYQAWLVRPRANAVVFDNASGEAVQQRVGTQLNVHHRISEAADPLHFGTFGGFWTRLIWFLFGAALSALAVSGVYLFGLRAISAARASRDTQPRTSWTQGWLAMQRGSRWSQVLVVTVGMGLAGYYFLIYVP